MQPKVFCLLHPHNGQSKQVRILYTLAEFHVDLFSRHACPLERAFLMLWRSTTHVGVQMIPRVTTVQLDSAHYSKALNGETQFKGDEEGKCPSDKGLITWNTSIYRIHVMVALSRTQIKWSEHLAYLSHIYNQPLCELELRQMEEAGSARSPTQALIHHRDPDSVNERARYKLSGLGLTMMAGEPRVRDYHELYTVRDASTMQSALPGK